MSLKVITTVVKAATSYDLTTLPVVKDELSIKDGSKDTILKRYITSASAAASNYCNRKFQAETVSDQFFPDQDNRWRSPTVGGVDRLQLTRWPIIDVVSVAENGTPLVEAVDFQVDYENGQLVRLDANLLPRKWHIFPLVVQYDGGYETIPDDLADAVIRMVSKRYAARGRDPSLKERDIPGVATESFWIATGDDAANMTPDVADILDNYRVPLTA